jgi:hypothetical protein
MPGYWGALLTHHKSGYVLSIDHMRNELVGRGDKLSVWAEKAPGTYFVSTGEPEVANAFKSMITWVRAHPQYFPAAKAEFAGVADGWLAAYAQAKRFTVVTEEVASADVKKKAPLPNVCNAFGVKWINTFEMLRALGVTFK